jgi:hypothetical protein
MRVLRVLLIATMMMGNTPGWSQDASFQASVNKNPVPLGEQFELSFTLTTSSMKGGKNFKPPDLGSFRIVAGPNQSTSMQFINGAVSSSVTYSYVLLAKDYGTYQIGSAVVEIEGQILKSAPITVGVVKGTPQAQKKPPDVSRDLSAELADNLFLRANVDKDHVLQGEQINLTFKLYTRVRIQDSAIEKTPSMTGFWAEELEVPRKSAISMETVDGKQFTVQVVRRVALFPTQSGVLEITPMRIQTAVRVQDRRFFDPFDSFFGDPFGRTVNYPIESRTIRVTVDPLPPGAPSTFKGAVGRFSMTATVDKKKMPLNEPVVFKVTIVGTGNVKLLESPAVELPVDFEQFSPKVSENVGIQNGLFSGSKTFEYLLIPRYPGRRMIKPATFTYFDLQKRQYVSVTPDPVEVVVDQPVGSSVGPLVALPGREGVQLLSQDIRFIKAENGSLSRRGERLYTLPWFVAASLVPVLCLAGALVFAKRRDMAARDVSSYRNRRAVRVARRGLRRAEQLLASSDQTGGFHAEVARSLWNYLGDKLDIPRGEMSLERALADLRTRGIDDGLSTSLRALIETCELARFAPAQLDRSGLQGTYDEAKRIITELEKVLRTK